MAFNNQEIELKLPLTKSQHQRIRKKLQKIAKFVKFSRHSDDYYTPTQNSFLKHKYPYEWLTLRRRDGKVILNYKHWYPEGKKYTTHCDEYQTEVSVGSQLEKILKALRFKKIVTVEKKREIFTYNDIFEIGLDEVKDLGYFIEVECMKDLGGVKRSWEEIVKFTHNLGLKRTKTIPGGYGLMLISKKGLLKR